jgi:hypothetical protein
MTTIRITISCGLFAILHAAAHAQYPGPVPVAANVAGPVTLKKSESISACLSNMGDSAVTMVLQVLILQADGTTKFLPAPAGRVDGSIQPGKTFCQSFKATDLNTTLQLPNGAIKLVILSRGVDATGATWATIGPNLLSSYEVLTEDGEVRLLVPSSQKVIQSNLLE